MNENENENENRPTVQADGVIDVLFENATLCDSSQWDWVRKELGPQFHSVTYDRAPTRVMPTLRAANSPQLLLLDNKEVRGCFSSDRPTIVVAHSIGGLLAQYYLAALPELIAGIVLVDPTHPDQFEKSGRQLNAYLWLNQRIALRGLRIGLTREISSEERASLSSLPPEARSKAELLLARPSTWLHAYRESRAASRSWSEAARKLGRTSRPIVVLESESASREDPIYESLLRELAAMSDVGEFTVVPETTHQSIVMDARFAPVITRAIERIVALNCPEIRK